MEAVRFAIWNGNKKIFVLAMSVWWINVGFLIHGKYPLYLVGKALINGSLIVRCRAGEYPRSTILISQAYRTVAPRKLGACAKHLCSAQPGN
jgi:hypothetical protein